MSKEKLQILIEEIKRVVGLPLTDYGAAKLLAFPLSAITKAQRQYEALRATGYEKMYSLSRQATLLEDKKPNTDKAHYVIEALELSFTDGDIVPQPHKRIDPKKKKELAQKNEEFFKAQLKNKTQEQRKRNLSPAPGAEKFLSIITGSKESIRQLPTTKVDGL